MGEATRRFFLSVLRDSVALLEGEGVDHLLIGSLATAVVLQREWATDEDIDFLVREAEADRLLDCFASKGFSIHRRDEHWIYKAAKPNVTVDLVFRAGEKIELDEDHLARSSTGNLDDVEVPVPAPEDLAVMKAVFDGEERPGRWYGALEILRECAIDWDYLAERGRRHEPDRLLSLLLYARSEGIEVPAAAIKKLAKEALR